MRGRDLELMGCCMQVTKRLAALFSGRSTASTAGAGHHVQPALRAAVFAQSLHTQPAFPAILQAVGAGKACLSHSAAQLWCHSGQ
jgi:hypothetical protein